MKDYFQYDQKVCVVTGAASGMGRATVEMLVNLGAIVYALDRNVCDVEGIAASIQTDLSDKQSIDDAYTKVPQHIDCFFGVAGLSGMTTDYYVTFTVNFIANKYMIEEYLSKRMTNGGAIAFVTSTAGNKWEKYIWEYRKIANADGWEGATEELHKKAPRDGMGVLAYCMSKRCMNYYASKKSVELGKRGIRVNFLLPASTDTGMKAEFEQAAGGKDELVAEAGLAGRLAESREMAEPLVFLNSNMASFINGLQLYVDAGDNAMKVLKIKKDRQDLPMGLKIYNTRLVRAIMNRMLYGKDKQPAV